MADESIGQQTLAIIDAGSYRSRSGAIVGIGEPARAAIAATILYRPDDFSSLLDALSPGSGRPTIEVTTETTASAGRRLVAKEGIANVVALNFASARQAGGGFLGGAKAQEEDLCRCSALYRCLVTQREYYDANRREGSPLYTNHMIYAPSVPFFRDEDLRLLDAPFLLSIITAPAPNAGEIQRRFGDESDDLVLATLRARARKVLAVAATHRHRAVILGAWGCGVFRNDASVVASAFAEALDDERLRHSFDRVVFAVFDRGGGRNLTAFERQFGRAQLL